MIAKANSQARSEDFHPVTIFERARCELASGYCDEWKRGFNADEKIAVTCNDRQVAGLGGRGREGRLPPSTL